MDLSASVERLSIRDSLPSINLSECFLAIVEKNKPTVVDATCFSRLRLRVLDAGLAAKLWLTAGDNRLLSSQGPRCSR